MTERLTISEACRLVGKSESTIKRMVRDIVSDPQHPDRDFIEPSHDEVERLRKTGERYTWGIAEELLYKRFPPEKTAASATVQGAPNRSVQSDRLVDILREQLGQKDQQLAALEKQLDRKDDQLANLSERQREANVLMKNLQERLALESPKKTRWSLSRLLGR